LAVAAAARSEANLISGQHQGGAAIGNDAIHRDHVAGLDEPALSAAHLLERQRCQFALLATIAVRR
jgi:hypothetical protein